MDRKLFLLAIYISYTIHTIYISHTIGYDTSDIHGCKATEMSHTTDSQINTIALPGNVHFAYHVYDEYR